MQATPGRPDSMYHPPQGLPGQSPSMGYAGQYGAPPRQMQTPVPVPVPVPVSPAPQHAQHAQAPPATAPYQMHQPPPPQTPGQNPFPPPQHAQPHPHYQQQQPQPQHTLQQFAPTSPAVHHPGQHPHQVPYQQQPHMQPHYQPQQQQQQAFAAMSPAPQHRQPIAAAPQVHHTPSQHHPSLLPPAHGNAYYPPGEVEVYTLGPQTDALVPEHIKKHFQRDENGNIIFFTKPPLERNHKGISAEHARLGHSARYLADYAREKKEAIVRKMESTDQGTKDNDDERWGATAPAVKPAGGSDATLPSTALQQNDATGPPAIPRSVLAALDPKFEDFERLEKLVRAKCGDHAFDAFSDWIVSMQDSTDMVNESLGNWREVKERDTAEKQQQKAAAAPQTTKPKKAWLIKHEREEAVRLKKEAGKQADLQNSIRWSADLAHYLKNKRLAAAKLASE
ncbi:hypothetical protein MKZ38_003934 [Zalerion maritima]|uniref:Uncharacterized protein n=1 Tax=Zalerion maritima TaxID=339359 RepID=A0AAD5WRD9_9PEZI|nr:hypothetical protein MKZ38_003934 [Zalerion maritima]